MARGYLGKISAVISANNGSYVRALNDSAAKTRDFARTIQSDLKRASSDATKSINSILTPIQRLERALQNARSQRLSFRGFEGAVRNIKELQSLLSRIGDREIQVALNSAGIKRSVDEIKRAINSIADADVDLFFNIVGRDGTLKDLQRLRDEAERTDGKVVGVKVSVERSEADRLLGLFRELSPQRLRKFTLAVETQQLDKAELQMRRLFSVSERIARPLSAAAESYTKFGAAVQKALGPTLVEAQNGAERLTKAIENNASVSERRFRNVARAADVVSEAFARQADAQSRAARVAETARSLDFRAPGVAGALDRASATAQAARSAPTFVRANPQAIENIQQLEAATERLLALQARYEARSAAGQNTSRVAAQLREQVDVVNQLSQGYQTLATTVGQARFDEAASQAQITFVAYNALGSTFRTSLRDLAASTSETLNAFERTGVGAEAARNAVEKFSAAVSAASGVEQISKSLEQASRGGGGFNEVVQAASGAFEQFNRLSEPLRQRLLPALQQTAGDAVELGTALANGANIGQRRVDALTARVKALSETIREVSDLSPDSLFRSPRDVRGQGQLNQSVRSLDAQFSGLSSPDRRSVQPFADAATDALRRLNEARVSDAPKKQIQALVVEYRSAVRDLEAFTKVIVDTQGAFSAATPTDKLIDRLAALRGRYDALGDSASKASRDLGEAARVATATALQPSAGAADRTNARQALDVADSSITRDERLKRVSEIFSTPRRDIDALLSEVEQLEEQFRQLPDSVKAAADSVRNDLRRAAKDVADTGQDTEANVLKKTIDRTKESLSSAPFKITIDIDADSLAKDAAALATRLRAEFDEIVNSLPAGSQPRVAIESAAAAAPPGSPPSDALRGQAEEAAERFKALGLAIDDPVRRIEVLRGSLSSLKGQLDQLPAPVQDLLVPALSRAEAEFQRLKNSGTATAAEISRASLAVQDLKNKASAVSRLDSFATFLGKRSSTGAEVLVRDFEAVNRAVDFFKVNLLGVRAPIEAWRTALQAAIADGTVGVPAVAKQLEILRRTAVETAAATAGIDTNRFLNTARNFGDVGRAGADRFSLALNQLAFVFDDLTSASGGLDMKFRAIQNNLTQIGFILGNTTGLWLALSAAIGGQIIIAITKFVLQTDLQQAKLKELNEALKAQQNAVESLAKAYSDLGNEIAKSGAGGPQARQLDRESRVRGIREIQDERNRQEAVSLSPEVAEIRGRRGLLQERLQNERNLQRRVQIQNEIERTRRQEAAAVARGVTPPSADDVQTQLVAAEQERVRQTQVRLNRARLRRRLGGVDPPGEDVDTLERELAQRQRDLRARRAAPAAAGQREQLTQLRSSLADLEQQRAGVVASGARTTEIDQAIDDVTTSIRRIEASLAPEVQKVVRSIIGKSLSIGETLGQAQSLIADALGDSAEARSLRREIAAESRNVARLVESVETATTPEEAREREAELSAARRRAAGLRSRAQAVQAQAIIDPQSLFDNVRARVERNLQDAGVPSGLLARRSRELQARRAALLQDLDSEDPFTRLRAERALPALDKEVRALEAATLQVNAFSQALARAEQEVASNLQSAQQRADETRRRDLRLGTPETREERRIAEDEFREQQEASRRAEETFRLERDRLEREAEAGRGPLAGDARRLRDIDEELDSGDVTRARREELEAERRRIQSRIDAAVEASPAVQAARDESTRIAERTDLARRGRDLILSSGEREARDLSENLEALRIEFGRQAEEGTGLIDQAGLAREQRRLVEESQRRIAPLAFQFSDEIANAILQGPSRAALGATDASTTQGQAELSRLIRGDDPARDVNLLELQKQTDELKKLNEKLAGTAEV